MEIAIIVYVIGYIVAYCIKKWDDNGENTWTDIILRFGVALFSWLLVLGFLLAIIPDLPIWRRKGPKWL